MTRVLIVHSTPDGEEMVSQTHLHGYRDFQRVLGGPIELVQTPWDGVIGYVNEVGRVVGMLPINHFASRLLADTALKFDEYIVGPLILSGIDPQTGNETDCPLDVEDVTA